MLHRSPLTRRCGELRTVPARRYGPAVYSRQRNAAPPMPDCPCCGLPFQPAVVSSIDDAPKTQPACRACMPHRAIRGEDTSRVIARAEEHAARAATAVKGAREEAHRLREKDRQRSEQLGAALSSRDFAWSRLDAVRQHHEVVGGRCRCGLSADRCQTLPLLTGRGMPPRNWRRDEHEDDLA